MTDILIGQSYYLRFDPKLWQAMQPYPPLGALYAAAYVRQQGYAVALFDAMLAESEAGWAEALDRNKPRFAVIYEDNFNYLSKMCLLRMREAAFTMIALARQRGCCVIVAGADASDHAEIYLQQGADFVLLGEGEITLGELLDQLTGKITAPLAEIPGLAYLTGDKSELTFRTAKRPDIKQLDSLPFPAWELVDLERYQQVWRQRHGYFSLNMVTTRGCPYHCNWCAKPIWGQRYNVRSPENVAVELQALKQTYQPDHISFVDDILGLKPGWLEQFAEMVERMEARVPFKCLSRADLLLRGETIAALQRAGCQSIWIGAESGSQRVLDAMEKGTTVAQIAEATRRVHEAGMKIGFFLQFGYPGESRAEIEQTLQLVRDCQPDDIGMSVSYPLPGTKFHEAVKLELDEQQNWRDSDDLAMLYRGPFSTEFYRKLHTVLHKEYRASKTWQKLRQGDWQLRSTAAMCYHALTLPLARWRLNQLAHTPHRPTPLPYRPMSQSAAAQPTPGGDKMTR